MKLDQITEKETTTAQVVSKKRETATTTGYSGSILELLNPLKSVNINSDLHSFNNFRESKESIEALLKAQSNLVFYVLHQNFMCDDVHKEFFKNMVGRFYDLHEKFWDYYRGLDYCFENNYGTMIGLVLLENKNLYERMINFDNSLRKRRFHRLIEKSAICDINFFNGFCLAEYWGIEFNTSYSKYFIPSNLKEYHNLVSINKEKVKGLYFKFEYGRFQTQKLKIEMISKHLQVNWWFIADFDWIKTSEVIGEVIEDVVKSYSVYASIGLDKFDDIIAAFKIRANELNIEWNDEWIPDWNFDDKKLIRSLSQTFQWSKEFIFENEDLLNLDVLGLNMTVPWDMDLVKFFVKRGYGGRMSENKAVFDKVFKPLLTDEILDMLFRLEYEKY